MTVRIGLVHALFSSIAPVEAAFAQAWPDAEVVSLYDYSLYADYRHWGKVTPEITRRVTALLEHTAQTGAHGILFTGSLFSESVEVARANMCIPVLTAYEAMIEEAFAVDTHLGLLATVTETITMIERDTDRYASQHGISHTLDSLFVAGAMDALQAGDQSRHDGLIAKAAGELVDCNALMLAQHSMGPAHSLVEEVPGRKILTSPDTAALKLRQLITASFCP